MNSLLRGVRRWILAPVLWWARDRKDDALDQSAWSRGRADARRAAADGRVFGLCTAVSTVAIPIVVEMATGSLPAVPRALLTIVAVVGGYLLVPMTWAIVGALTAPVRPRNELRTRLGSTSEGDLSANAQHEIQFVPPSHDQQLRATLQHLQIRIGQQTELDFGDPVGGIKLYQSAFAAHFPQLLDRVQEWNEAVRAVKSAHSDYATALAAEADELEIEPPTYDREVILRALSERTRPSLHLALEEWSPEQVPVRGYDDGRVEFAGVVTEVPKPVASVHLQKLVAPLVELCRRARELSEVKTIASTQDVLAGLIQPFLDELRLELFVEGIRVASNCPVCQRNMAAQDVSIDHSNAYSRPSPRELQRD